MPKLVLDVPSDLFSRVNDWGLHFNCKPENLAVELLQEYFDDCDDADKLEALIQSGQMPTFSADAVHKELANVAG